MPRFSTHMHFGKLLIESTDDEIDIRSFILGLAAPDTFIDDETFEDYHFADEDGDIDVRAFYESFDWDSFGLEQKSFVLGYYSHLWLDEYFKFNASKLTVHNKNDLPDEELGQAVKNLLEYYDNKIVDGFFDNIKDDIDNFILELNIVKLNSISTKKSKGIVTDYFKKIITNNIHTELIDEVEYTELISKSYSKFINSLD